MSVKTSLGFLDECSSAVPLFSSVLRLQAKNKSEQMLTKAYLLNAMRTCVDIQVHSANSTYDGKFHVLISTCSTVLDCEADQREYPDYGTKPAERKLLAGCCTASVLH